MAARKTSASGRGRAKAKPAAAKRKKGSRGKSNGMAFENEILLWILLAASILLFVSNFGIGGKVGNAASAVLFGIFGLMAYIFPVVLFIGLCFLISNKRNYFAFFKFIASVLLFCAICMFLQLIAADKGTAQGMIKRAYTYSVTYKAGGGAVGGFFVWLCLPNFGRFGSYVIDFAAMIISLVLITERSVLRGVKSGGRKVYESAREDMMRYHDNQQKREQERELKRMERKVEGVALDTSILPERQQGGDDISEIMPKRDGDFPTVRETEHIPVTAAQTDDLPLPEIHIEPADTKPKPDIFGSGDAPLPDIHIEPAGEARQDPLSAEDEEARMLEQLLSDVGSMVEPLPDDPFLSDDPVFGDGFTTEGDPSFKSGFEEMGDPVCGNGFSAEDAPDFCEGPAELDHDAPAKTRKKEGKETGQENEALAGQMDAALAAPAPKQYVFPPVSLLKKGNSRAVGDGKVHLMATANKLQQTLKNFGVNVTITNVSSGPSVTRYEIQPEMGVKVSKIVNLTDDIKLNLAAADIRMEAPIPGKAAIGIEIPNKESVTVMFRDLIESEEFQENSSNIAFAAGKDIGGQTVVTDIAKMPHLLIAGATGSGKSVCINTIIMSILYKAHPDEVKMIMVDPKVVELSVYNGIPHLLIPVVTDPKKAAGALNWAVAEMDDRYKKFAEHGVRDLKGYNAKMKAAANAGGEEQAQALPQIVIIVDELADLMMVASHEVETAICRLAQLARAAGLHLIIATQRPSVNVITGLIKANMPSRIAFAVTSGVDSRTILDMVGAEKLLGKGDMLFFPQNYQKPQRIQGAFVSDQEVSDVVDFLKQENGSVRYNPKVQEKMEQSENISMPVSDGSGAADDRDVLFVEAGRFLIESEKGSIGSIQRKFKVGFNRAARIMDQLSEAGLVGPEEGTKPRKVLMSQEEFEQYLQEGRG